MTNFVLPVKLNNMITIKKYGKKTCAPCISMGRILNRVLKKQVFELVEIEVNDSPELAENAMIQSVPTTVLEVHGKEVHRFTGVKSSKEISKLIETYATLD